MSDTAPTRQELLAWLYEQGLRLDSIIPLQGMDNMQRIEAAISLLPNKLSEANATIERLQGEVDRLRGQLQNCVNHMDRIKRSVGRSEESKLNAAIDSANRALYETLIGRPQPPQENPDAE